VAVNTPSFDPKRRTVCSVTPARVAMFAVTVEGLALKRS
jgi:hypothetical protein